MKSKTEFLFYCQSKALDTEENKVHNFLCNLLVVNNQKIYKEIIAIR